MYRYFQSMNLISDIGGQLGLWLGLSAITVGELIEFFGSLGKVIFARCFKSKTHPNNNKQSLAWDDNNKIRNIHTFAWSYCVFLQCHIHCILCHTSNVHLQNVENIVSSFTFLNFSFTKRFIITHCFISFIKTNGW